MQYWATVNGWTRGAHILNARHAQRNAANDEDAGGSDDATAMTPTIATTPTTEDNEMTTAATISTTPGRRW